VTDFNSLNLSSAIVKALIAEGYTVPTPIQRRAIPNVLAGRDLLGIAQTGTGKTAAFALPILDQLAANRRPAAPRAVRALVLAPTRELAGQIAQSFRTYGQFLKPSVVEVFGGVPINRQIRQLQAGADIVVATPGRLLDLAERRAVTLSKVEHLVLDEADQMLDLGFIHALRRIIPLLPAERQTLLFSATMPKTISDLADRYLTDPVKVEAAPVASTAERVEQRAVFVRQADKLSLLAHVLGDPAIGRALVFTRTKHGADKVVRGLKAAGVEAAAIHGNKSQPQRERALGAFKTGTCRVLVATDIAARGIHVEAVGLVVNFDLPNVAEQYVHRIGRTARAGASGLAVSFVSEDERSYLRAIERLTRQKIAIDEIPGELPAVSAPPRERRPGAGAKKPKRAPQSKKSGQSANGQKPSRARKRRRRSRSRAPAAA
jgi:ATP-dependent RNA helicase RhlE